MGDRLNVPALHRTESDHHAGRYVREAEQEPEPPGVHHVDGRDLLAAAIHREFLPPTSAIESDEPPSVKYAASIGVRAKPDTTYFS